MRQESAQQSPPGSQSRPGPAVSPLLASPQAAVALIIIILFSVACFRAFVAWKPLEPKFVPNPWGVISKTTVMQFPHQIKREYYYFGIIWTTISTSLLMAGWAAWNKHLARLDDNAAPPRSAAALSAVPLLLAPLSVLYCLSGLGWVILASAALAVVCGFVMRRTLACDLWPALWSGQLFRGVEVAALLIAGFASGLSLRFALQTQAPLLDGAAFALLMAGPFAVLLFALASIMLLPASRTPQSRRALAIRLARFALPWFMLLFPDLWLDAHGTQLSMLVVVALIAAVLAALPTRDAEYATIASPRWIIALWVIAFVIRVKAPWLLIDGLLRGAPETALLHPSFPSTTEWGFRADHAWRIAHGQYQGRDFYSLYGPLYNLVRSWSGRLCGDKFMFGAAIAEDLDYAAGILTFIAAAWCVTRSAVWTTVAGLLMTYKPTGSLRMGLPMLAGAVLFTALDTGKLIYFLPLGALTALSFAYSQEYAAALILALLGLWLVYLFRGRRAWALRGMGLALAGAAVVAAPFLIYFGSAHALGPLLHDLAEYPRVVNEGGYCAELIAPLSNILPVPMPSGIGLKMLSIYTWSGWLPLYILPLLVVAGGLFFLLRLLADRGLLTPLSARIGFVAAMGMAAVHTLLGRSDEAHAFFVVPWATLLVILACQALFNRYRAISPGLAVAVVLAPLFIFTSPADLARPFDAARTALDELTARAYVGRPEYPVGSLANMGPVGHELQDMITVIDRVKIRTLPSDRVCFWPYHVALNYLADRHDNSRFSIIWFAITDAHRAELLDSIRTSPPKAIVMFWDGRNVGDGISLRQYAPDIADFISENYTIIDRIGFFSILEYHPQSSTPPNPRTAADPRTFHPPSSNL